MKLACLKYAHFFKQVAFNTPIFLLLKSCNQVGFASARSNGYGPYVSFNLDPWMYG